MSAAGPKALLQQLLAHQRWADEQTFAALVAMRGEPTVAHERFMHLIAAEHIWITRICSQPAQTPVWPPFTVDGCRHLMAQNHRGFESLLKVDDAQFLLPIDYTTTDGRPFRNTTVDMLLHVVLHGSWHRGQIALLMRQQGVQPVASDYIAFVRGAPAAITPRD